MEEVEPSLLYNHNSAGVTIVYTSINVENCGVSLSEQHRAASFDQDFTSWQFYYRVIAYRSCMSAASRD